MSSDEKEELDKEVVGEATGQSKDGMPNMNTTEFLREYMMTALGFGTPEKHLETVDLDGIVKYMLSDKCKNIITMAGAGISTSAGIPDFRSPGTGLYDNLQKYNLPVPQSVFDIGYFWKNPEPFFMLAKELWPGSFKPTPCHYFLKMLQDKGLLLRHYTQNIDTLEMVAGLDSSKLVEAHGSFKTSHCLICEKEYDLDWMEGKVMEGVVPKCTEEDCDSVVKPDIVFFGEPLPRRFSECVQEDFTKCDLLIIMGTSLVVQPFASLTSRVKSAVPRLYINMEKTGAGSSHPISVLMFGGGFAFDDEDNYRDVFLQGTCDDGCSLMAEKLGWGDEFKELVASEHAKIEEKIGKSAKSESGSKSEISQKDQATEKRSTTEASAEKTSPESADKSSPKTSKSADIFIPKTSKSADMSSPKTSKSSDKSSPKTSKSADKLSTKPTNKASPKTNKKT